MSLMSPPPMWEWRSRKPGTSHWGRRSSTAAPAGTRAGSHGPTQANFPSFTTTSPSSTTPAGPWVSTFPARTAKTAGFGGAGFGASCATAEGAVHHQDTKSTRITKDGTGPVTARRRPAFAIASTRFLPFFVNLVSLVTWWWTFRSNLFTTNHRLPVDEDGPHAGGGVEGVPRQDEDVGVLPGLEGSHAIRDTEDAGGVQGEGPQRRAGAEPLAHGVGGQQRQGPGPEAPIARAAEGDSRRREGAGPVDHPPLDGVHEAGAEEHADLGLLQLRRRAPRLVPLDDDEVELGLLLHDLQRPRDLRRRRRPAEDRHLLPEDVPPGVQGEVRLRLDRLLRLLGLRLLLLRVVLLRLILLLVILLLLLRLLLPLLLLALRRVC